jgi:hypothetical protein
MDFYVVIRWSIWICFFIPSALLSQTSYPLQKMVIRLDSCDIKLGKNSLLPSSVGIKSLDGNPIRFRILNNTVIIDSADCKKYAGNDLEIKFRTFGFNISEPVMLFDTMNIPSEKRPLLLGYNYIVGGSERTLIDSKELDYRGSFSRGVSIGNSQNLAVNSNFDLQLIGDLGNGLKIVAAITDESLPIQAEGNTQQLQEFDKVFIQVSKNKTTLTAGDYVLGRPESHFMNYFKKLKGLNIATSFDRGKNIQLTTQGSFAISNGKFARQNLVTSEGNQGPYRLVGPNGERFIIVLAGTEKVYFNGQLLKRGYDFDYVIDYNRAELVFTPTRVIARDARVIVEFEYTDISYLRSLYAANTTFKGKKWKVDFNFYNEQDSKNGTGDLELDSTAIRILTQGGEELEGINRSGIRNIALSDRTQSNLILYKRIYDLDDPEALVIQFTTNIDSAAYTAIFSEVAPGLGDYVIDNSLAKNGRIYRYVGKGMGTYLPIIQLIPPEKKQLITLGGRYQISKSTDVNGEFSFSHQDRNRLSNIGNNDNMGVAAYFEGGRTFKLDSIGSWKLSTRASHEFVHRDFKSLNPYRVAEFTRDWNIATFSDKGDEHLSNVKAILSKGEAIHLDLSSGIFTKSSLYQGLRQQAQFSYRYGRWQVRSTTNYLQSKIKSLLTNTTFLRPNAELTYHLTKDKRWAMSVLYDGESNQSKHQETNILLARSYTYHYGKASLRHELSESFGLVAAVSQRVDDLFKSDKLARAAKATEIELGGKWTPRNSSDLQWNIIARDLSILQPELLPNDISKKSLLGKLDYNWDLLRSGIRSTTSYNTSSGQEPKIEYVFQRVEVGQGDYFLINETEIPNLTNVQDFRYDPSNPLSKYIRLTLVNNEFIRTNNIELNQNFQFDGSRIWEKKDSVEQSLMAKFASKISTQSNLRFNKKQLASSAFGFQDYFNFGLGDTSIVAYTTNNTHSIFFNRGQVKYDLQLGSRNNSIRVTQVNGIEDRGLNALFARIRWNIVTPLDIYFHYEQSNKTYASALFKDRNLNIEARSFKPEINYRPTGQSRIILRGTYTAKKQLLLKKEKATISEYYAEYSLRKSQKYSIDLRCSYLKIAFAGAANSPIEYDMLESLKNGDNFLWGGQVTKRLAKNIDLSFVYDGRKTGVSPMIHIGRAQMKATF